MLNHALSLLAAVALSSGVQTTPQAPAQAQDEQGHVTVALVSATVQIAAGEEFELGAHFALPDGWHIGWEHPGDFGAPTNARLLAPKGFEVVGPLRAAPRAFTLDDGRVTFGHAGEVVYFFRLRAPSDLAESSHVTFALYADWLALGPAEAALAGEQRAELTLPTYPLRDAAPSGAPQVLEFMRARVPQPWKQLENADLTWAVSYGDTGEGLGLELALDVAQAEQLEWFPYRIENLDWAGASFRATEERGFLRVAYQWYSATKAPPPDVRGVLRVVRDGVETFFEARATRPTPLAGR